MTQILDGKVVAEKILNNVKKEVSSLSKKGIKPKLDVILVGDNPASLVFIKEKKEACRLLGIGFELHKFDKQLGEEILLKLVESLNQDIKTHGILVQLPLPYNLDGEKIISKISIKKDVDGFKEENLDKLIYGQEKFAPAVVGAIMEILKFYNIKLADKKIVILGRGRYVGQPIALKLISQKLKPIVCNENTKDIEKFIKRADILISAVGKPKMIKRQMVKKGVVVIDVGTKFVGGKITGDADFRSLENWTGAITPTPGGVGPVTVACLLRNVVKAAKSASR